MLLCVCARVGVVPVWVHLPANSTSISTVSAGSLATGPFQTSLADLRTRSSWSAVMTLWSSHPSVTCNSCCLCPCHHTLYKQD